EDRKKYKKICRKCAAKTYYANYDFNLFRDSNYDAQLRSLR
ncbi:4954_t:CDS:1, partial [Racocetra persica]